MQRAFLSALLAVIPSGYLFAQTLGEEKYLLGRVSDICLRDAQYCTGADNYYRELYSESIRSFDLGIRISKYNGLAARSQIPANILMALCEDRFGKRKTSEFDCAENWAQNFLKYGEGRRPMEFIAAALGEEDANVMLERAYDLADIYYPEPSSYDTQKLEDTPQKFVISADEDGHFRVEFGINEYRDLGVIDTGATYVSLTRSAARGSGIDFSSLKYDVQIQTANGQAMFAASVIREMQIFGATYENVEVIVPELETSLNVNLIGMSLLRDASSVAFSDGSLTIIP